MATSVKVKYLGSPAGDTFTYLSGNFRLVMQKGKTYSVPAPYHEALLKDTSFEVVEDKAAPVPADKEGK